MKRLFIAANKMPVTIDKQEDMFAIVPGERSTIYDLPEFKDKYETCWVGHTGVDNHIFSDQ
ncbi:MAG: hypothetical protein QNK33_05975 [Bacteroidales bacterium]|nr:hypothetical protein [Bacteroidales bacterium]